MSLQSMDFMYIIQYYSSNTIELQWKHSTLPYNTSNETTQKKFVLIEKEKKKTTAFEIHIVQR